MAVRLTRTSIGYARGSFEVERCQVDGRRAWRVRDVSGLGKADFTVPTLGDVRRWFAWLEGEAK